MKLHYARMIRRTIEFVDDSLIEAARRFDRTVFEREVTSRLQKGETMLAIYSLE